MLIKMTDQKIDQKLLQQAIKVLRDLTAKHYEDSSKKKPLLEDEKEPTLYLQFSLKKIPKCKSIKMIKINLPHSLLKDNSEVCLITGDLDKKNHKAEIEPDVLHYKQLLKKHDIDNISEVITLRQLRTEYKPFEAKQKLLAAYDVFLADRKIAGCLPKVLGRHFFKKRKFPLQITLNTPNLKQQIEKALSTKVFFLTGHGNSCNSEIAYLDMTDQEISENVMEMTKTLCDIWPGSWDNVMGIYLKTSLSKAIPVFMSYDDPNKVILEDEKCDNSYEVDELSTCLNSLVKVYKDGTVRTVRLKRMAEAETFENADAGESSDRKKQKKENIDGSLKKLRNTDLNVETSNITKNKKKKIEINKDNTLESTDLKEESTNSKKKTNKKKKSILQEDADQFIMKDEGEVSNISKKKKKETENNKDDALESTDMKEESTNSKKKTNKKRKNLLEEDADQFTCTMKEKEKAAEFQSQRKSKNKRKSDGSVLLKEVCDSTTSAEMKGKSGKLSKKAKSNRKNMENISSKNDECLTTSKLKGKLKKMKINLVNNI